MQTFLLLSALIVALNGDCYLHYFRGSNNRLNERSANRNNANRLFDSQNNNRGGYNCCDLDTQEGFDEDTYMASASEMYDWRFLYETNDDNTAVNPLEKQYEELYFVESDVSITWTNQHGTGNKKLLSQMILQYGCDTFPRPDEAGDDGFGPDGKISGISSRPDGTSCGSGSDCRDNMVEMRKFGLRMELMNGGNTNTPDDPDSIADISDEYSDNNAANRGRHESEEWYYLCETRMQQYGLFHADQDLHGNSQIYTRQNPNGNRRGLECPEERDYYPWWHPTPWHDIAIITPDVDYCNNYQAPISQNVQEYYSCVNPDGGSSDTSVTEWFPEKEYIHYNLNSTMCEMMGGSYESFKWGGDKDNTQAGVDKPECVDSYWTKVNYLGNVDGSVRGGKQAHYDWRLPAWTDLRDKHMCWPYRYTIEDSSDSNEDYTVSNVDCVRMVFRIRYNISTMDYDPYKTNSTHDYHPEDGILSPIEENPEVDVGFYVQGLQLAINTAQTGRTFQDRSHTFLVCKRLTQRDYASKAILNVNVRGKRGNIVQTFPATEYDFEPQHIELASTEDICLHFQWCGSNTHNNGAPAGDGQAGDDGEGTGGTDRSSLVQMKSMDESYPVTYDKIDDNDNWFNYFDCYHPFISMGNNDEPLSNLDAQLVLGTMGFYKSKNYLDKQCNDIDTKDCIVDELLNNVSASFRGGLICCLNDKAQSQSGDGYVKIFAFLSTRNNNFTNRSQKLKIVITDTPDDHTLW